MKQTILFLLCLLSLTSFAKVVSVGATSNGLWCDLITLRTEVAKETGKPLAHSAYEECKVLGLVKDSASFVSELNDTLTYDTETDELTFTSENYASSLIVATNARQAQGGDPTYAVFTPGIGCNCTPLISSTTTAAISFGAPYDDAKEDMYPSYAITRTAAMHAPLQIQSVAPATQKVFNKICGGTMQLSKLLNHNDGSFIASSGKVNYTATIESTSKGKKITVVYAKDKIQLTAENGTYVLKRLAHNEVLFRYPCHMGYVLKSTKERLQLINHALSQT
jgi:hypothetical protein